MPSDTAITDYSTAVFLRYFRSGTKIKGAIPRLKNVRDVELLKSHWAVSEPVRRFVDYVSEHPHEAQSLLDFNETESDAVARGRIDARKTWQRRMQTGLPSIIVSHESVRSFLTGPNHVLAWVLKESSAYTSRLASWQSEGSPYLEIIEHAEQVMRSTRRIEALREPIRHARLSRRPSANAIRAAVKARKPIYRLATEAYQLLQGIERFDQAAIEDVVQGALIGPLEEWRRFELAVGLAVSEALSDVTGEELHLNLLGGESKSPMASVGKYAIYWQYRTTYYNQPEPESSEIKTREILLDYGMFVGGDRPDLVVLDRSAKKVVAIVEVKYVSGDSSNARFREAAGQIVKYGRGYADEPDEIIGNSVIAISHSAPRRVKNNHATPFSVGFEGIRQHELFAWAEQIDHPVPVVLGA